MESSWGESWEPSLPNPQSSSSPVPPIITAEPVLISRYGAISSNRDRGRNGKGITPSLKSLSSPFSPSTRTKMPLGWSVL